MGKKKIHACAEMQENFPVCMKMMAKEAHLILIIFFAVAFALAAKQKKMSEGVDS